MLVEKVMRGILPVFVIVCAPFFTKAQNENYLVAGSATENGNNCFIVTNSGGQAGAVWNKHLIDLTLPFDITLNLNFGSDDGGADGMSFVLQNQNTQVISTGSGVGFTGITPSFGVIMDTYNNGDNGDPVNDHISIHKNGDVNHGTSNELVSFSQANGFPANVEDGNEHSFRFVWVPGGTATVYFDGNLVFTYTGDIVNAVFGGNPMVYWGISASTGLYFNTQTVCLNIAAQYSHTGIYCAGESIYFTDASGSGVAITNWHWDFGDGSTSTDQNPAHVFQAAGTYSVTLEITNQAGLKSATTTEIDIHGVEVLISGNTDYCLGEQVVLTASGAQTYLWDNLQTSNPYIFEALAPGEHQVTGTSEMGCKQTKSVVINVENCDLTIPNVITPNGDASNENFAVTGLENYRERRLQIYNRWGKLVYENDSYNNDWNGNGCADGTYFYVLNIANGDYKKMFKGTITIIAQK